MGPENTLINIASIYSGLVHDSFRHIVKPANNFTNSNYFIRDVKAWDADQIEYFFKHVEKIFNESLNILLLHQSMQKFYKNLASTITKRHLDNKINIPSWFKDSFMEVH